MRIKIPINPLNSTMKSSKYLNHLSLVHQNTTNHLPRHCHFKYHKNNSLVIIPRQLLKPLFPSQIHLLFPFLLHIQSLTQFFFEISKNLPRQNRIQTHQTSTELFPSIHNQSRTNYSKRFSSIPLRLCKPIRDISLTTTQNLF